MVDKLLLTMAHGEQVKDQQILNWEKWLTTISGVITGYPLKVINIAGWKIHRFLMGNSWWTSEGSTVVSEPRNSIGYHISRAGHWPRKKIPFLPTQARWWGMLGWAIREDYRIHEGFQSSSATCLSIHSRTRCCCASHQVTARIPKLPLATMKKPLSLAYLSW